jgi:hypothetical protein
MTTLVYANSSRARCPIYSRDTAICIYSVSNEIAKIRLSKYHYGPKLWASQNIFAGWITFEFWPKMAIS